MSSTFPLFNLPFVPLSNVLNTVKWNELLKISLCSKKSSKITKFVRNKSKEVYITFVPANSDVELKRDDDHIELFFAYNISELPRGQHEQLRIGDIVVPITKRKGEDSLNTYWKDQFFGVTKILDLVTDFFDSPINYIVLSAENHPNDHRRIIDWIMGRQGSIASVYFECEKTTEEELKYFLDTCKITDDLYLVIKTSEQFNHTIHFEMEKLMLKYAHWLTLDNLFALNCRYMEIYHSSFTSNNINAFLNHWANNGGNSRLGMLALQTNKPVIMDVITAGLNAVLRINDTDRVFKVLNGKSIAFDRSYDIRRNDGTMGSILQYPDCIYFLVWPDWENTPYS